MVMALTRLGPDVYLYVHALAARKMSHCLLHTDAMAGCCAADAASLVTTTALVAECTRNNWANGPHSHFNLCTLAHFIHLLASCNGSPVAAMFKK